MQHIVAKDTVWSGQMHAPVHHVAICKSFLTHVGKVQVEGAQLSECPQGSPPPILRSVVKLSKIFFKTFFTNFKNLVEKYLFTKFFLSGWVFYYYSTILLLLLLFSIIK